MEIGLGLLLVFLNEVSAEVDSGKMFLRLNSRINRLNFLKILKY